MPLPIPTDSASWKKPSIKAKRAIPKSAPPGAVRMWRSGEGADKGGKRWFSGSEQYGCAYRADQHAFYVDVLRDDPMFASDYDDQTVDQGFIVNKAFDPADYRGAKPGSAPAATVEDATQLQVDLPTTLTAPAPQMRLHRPLLRT